MRPPQGQTLEQRLAWYGVCDSGVECIAPRVLTNPRANGYWDVSFEGQATYLHRLILRANIGELDAEVQARHTCGHKWCVNRSHIIPGTIADNMRDQYELGERVMNERHPQCRLSTDAAREIRNAPRTITTRSLAHMHGLSISYVNEIRAGSRRRFIDQTV